MIPTARERDVINREMIHLELGKVPWGYSDLQGASCSAGQHYGSEVITSQLIDIVDAAPCVAGWSNCIIITVYQVLESYAKLS